MRRSWVPLFATVLAAAFSIAASASPITTNPTLSSGGFTFNNFSCNVTPQSSGTVVPQDCSNTSVTATSNILDITNGIVTTGIGTPDEQLAFAVSSGKPINQVGLSFTYNISGNTELLITETVYASSVNIGSQTPLATISLCEVSGGAVCHAGSINASSATVSIVPSSSLYILKDIGFIDNAQNSSSTYVDIFQSFGVPVTTNVPEPAAIGLFGSAFAFFGILGLRRRNKV